MNDLNCVSVSADHITILKNPTDYYQQVLHLIEQAQNRIVITALYLENDEAGQDVLKRLICKKQAIPTLDIIVLVDDHRARRGLIGHDKDEGNQAFYRQAITEAGVDIKLYGVRVKSKELLGVMHLKGMIFDDTVLYTGASINNVYMHTQKQYRLDRYYTIENKSLADSMCQFVNDNLIDTKLVRTFDEECSLTKSQLKKLSRKTFYRLNNSQYQIEQPEDKKELVIYPIVGCGSKGNVLNKTCVELIEKSQRSIMLITPYFNFPRPIEKALSSALARGVKVELVVGDKRANDFFICQEKPFRTIGIIPYLYEHLLCRMLKKWQQFIETGDLAIHCWRHEANSFHAKGMIVDEEYHLITGSNLNPRAWRLDLENALLIHDKQQQLLPRVSQEVTGILEHTMQVRCEDDIRQVDEYPDKVLKLLKRIKMSRTDHLIKRFL
ncbi:CDP-diacylglycerol--serine O-phosphatidyltransferase [Thalassotalea marina]|uniref:CDP-diacylglycerol--serine O-phosphatidyltransferase n=1 Tax=Thalassotalea marina TaxID=1673741 RepID=A0A919BBF4_9GAMM|nr:CDP-diacylglycerol--serine O-phosphatidyltransferase [Thalassotalea marina]GHF77066.1 CDP-diacylglycerol--serine O-phosphatidyltransferase [Thalassotalea marina]